MLTLDGDFHMAYYRTDVAKELGLSPPKTWDDYLAFAAAANGKDMNGDGKPDFGSCISKKRNAQAYWFIYDLVGPMVQAKGTSEGVFFDTADMKPLVNNEAFAEALRLYNETTKYGPPNEINLDVGDTRNLFISGQCALSIDWGDIGSLAIDKEKSKVIDKVGAMITPGSKKVLDRASGKLVDCTADICPYAKDGVNTAPLAAFGGWSGGVNAKADPKVKDAAYAFFSYMSQPEQSNVDVTIGASGFNPYRLSQFQQLDNWTKAGMSEEAAKNYLGAIQDSLNSPNMILDLRIPLEPALSADRARHGSCPLSRRRDRHPDDHEDDRGRLERSDRGARQRRPARRLQIDHRRQVSAAIKRPRGKCFAARAFLSQA